MREEDVLLLESLEDVDFACKEVLQKLRNVRSVHVQKLEQILSELQSERRIFEDISIPARLVVEQLMEFQLHDGHIAVETEYFKLPFRGIDAIQIEKFGIIKIILAGTEIIWRDDNYSYYFYPDKVELRARDEKSAIKLFFANAFHQQTVKRFADLKTSPNVMYVHSQLETWLRGED